MTGGALLIIVGAWVFSQVIAGDALGRLGIISGAAPSTGPSTGSGSTPGGGGAAGNGGTAAGNGQPGTWGNGR